MHAALVPHHEASARSQPDPPRDARAVTGDHSPHGGGPLAQTFVSAGNRSAVVVESGDEGRGPALPDPIPTAPRTAATELLVATAVVGVLLVSGLAFVQLREQITNARKATLQAAVQSQATLVAGYQAAAAAGKMSEADAMKAAGDAVRMARYGDLAGKADYFYILTTDGLAVMHPHLTRWVPGKTVLGTLNSKGIDAAKMLTDGMASSSADFARRDEPLSPSWTAGTRPCRIIL